MLKKALAIAVAFAALIFAGDQASAGPEVAAKFTASADSAVQPVFHGPGPRFHGGFRGHGFHGHGGWHGHNAWRGHSNYGRHYGYLHHDNYSRHHGDGHRYRYGRYSRYGYGGGNCYGNCREDRGAGYCERSCD
jgi:hypothetical protein